MTLSRERALELQQRGIRDWIALLGASSEGASLVRRGGVTASVCPACPQRSICSSVTYTDAGELAATLDELAAIYDAAGIAAWTVWVPEFDREAIAALEAAGHELDAAPVAMSLELAGFEPPEVGDLDWDNDVDPADLGRLNDLAYDLPPESLLSPALTAPPANPDLRLYQARIGGRPACVLGTIDHGGADLGVYFVATHPDHRGLGLASRLMTVALGEAIERGLETSSLQGSIMGQSVYRRLGYSDDFTLTMRERRR
ncbi:MAG: GNAT family N-acetyltransferase [Vicinamibacteria bacterium]